jgi:hypothetical protein
VVLSVFSSIDDRNTTLVIATIGMVYTAMRGSALWTAFTMLSLLPTLLAVDKIAAAVVPGHFAEEITPRELESKQFHATMKLWINSIGLTVITIVCLLQFFSVL